jgi:rfaE bifunctional protein kinase chain/domain
MIDRYLTGNVDRISPEAPVPIVHLNDSDNRLGGAANVALNLKALGATPYLCSVIGKDENAEVFLNLLPENQLSTRGIIQSSERVTTVKTRVIANHQHLLRVDREDTHDLSSKEEEAYLNNIRDLLESKEFHVILFQDYNKGVLSYNVIRGIILDAIKRDIPTAVDPKYKNFWAYKHVTLFKPNLKEIRTQLEQDVAVNMTDLTEASAQIKSKLGNQLTMITLSEKGLFIEDDKKYTDVVPTQERIIADVCGAGDTVISVTSLCLALGIDPKEIAVLANLAGGQVCEKIGVVPVDKEQLRQEYISLYNRKINQ